MSRFPRNAPLRDVLKALERLGFVLVREGNHISMCRNQDDGTKQILTLPNHRNISGATLRLILTQAGIPRDNFLEAFEKK